MVNPAHENTQHEDFARVEAGDADEFAVSFTGPDGQPWRIRALPVAESPVLREDPILWVVEDSEGQFQDVLLLPEDLLAVLTDADIHGAAPASVAAEETTDALFPVGRLRMTPGAADALHIEGLLPEALVARHARGDWGDLCAEDRRVNRDALRHGQRLLSAYTLPTTQATVWVITEAGRETTTLLLPSEY